MLYNVTKPTVKMFIIKLWITNSPLPLYGMAIGMFTNVRL